ncbi:hypothetical protein PR202_ga09066 [Eleusine coracana subsp. coracana]|uniref:Uncharacterized protein n=1 Tax=Eleusine coracana subsp. coracana TaxID=191504 RepID=A0AAV5C3T7_ELECO|nr:hypothetical protein PR202_ga09066 [Eleusine coracana subsp. coracana]
MELHDLAKICRLQERMLQQEHTYLKGRYDAVTSVGIPLALAASSLFLILLVFAAIFEKLRCLRLGIGAPILIRCQTVHEQAVQQNAPVDDNDSGMVMVDNPSCRPVGDNDSGMALLDALSYRPVDDCGSHIFLLFHALYVPVLRFDELDYSPVDFSELVCFPVKPLVSMNR